jgi:hypothetical protein
MSHSHVKQLRYRREVQSGFWPPVGTILKRGLKVAYEFELGDEVTIQCSGETGLVVGRAEYDNAEPSYFVRYKHNMGWATTSWWTEGALEKHDDVRVRMVEQHREQFVDEASDSRDEAAAEFFRLEINRVSTPEMQQIIEEMEPGEIALEDLPQPLRTLVSALKSHDIFVDVVKL